MWVGWEQGCTGPAPLCWKLGGHMGPVPSPTSERTSEPCEIPVEIWGRKLIALFSLMGVPHLLELGTGTRSCHRHPVWGKRAHVEQEVRVLGDGCRWLGGSPGGLECVWVV